jgi:hypothetical protein
MKTTLAGSWISVELDAATAPAPNLDTIAIVGNPNPTISIAAENGPEDTGRYSGSVGSMAPLIPTPATDEEIRSELLVYPDCAPRPEAGQPPLYAKRSDVIRNVLWFIGAHGRFPLGRCYTRAAIRRDDDGDYSYTYKIDQLTYEVEETVTGPLMGMARELVSALFSQRLGSIDVRDE